MLKSVYHVDQNNRWQIVIIIIIIIMIMMMMMMMTMMIIIIIKPVVYTFSMTEFLAFGIILTTLTTTFEFKVLIENHSAAA